MKVIKNTGLVYFDVDDTLVRYDLDTHNNEEHEYVYVNSKIKGTIVTLRVHRAHVELLKTFKRRGKTIVVWTHAGWQWANEVVKALELKEFVDLIIEKPDRLVDDMPTTDLARRIYLNDEGGET